MRFSRNADLGIQKRERIGNATSRPYSFPFPVFVPRAEMTEQVEAQKDIKGDDEEYVMVKVLM